jgi:hypothetical protein
LFDQVDNDPLDKYFVSVPYRASWQMTSMPVASVMEKQAKAVGTSTTSQPRQKGLKKVPKKLEESEPKKKAKVKRLTYKCKRNDGKRWQCSRPVSSPNSLCDYHVYQKRANPNPEFAALTASEAKAEKELKVPQPAAASKSATSSKPRKRPGQDLAVTENFYYYDGFGPCRSKRQCRSSGMNYSVPPMKHDEVVEQAEDDAKAEKELEVSQPAAASKPATMSKSRKRTGQDSAVTEGFYYYTGFGPARSKRLCRSSSMNHSVPPMKQDKEEKQAEDDQHVPNAADGPVVNKAAAHEEAPSCDDDISGGDEETSDDGYSIGGSGRNKNGNGEHRDGKRKKRSLKSLM